MSAPNQIDWNATLKSRTVWANLIGLILAILAAAESALPVLQGVIPARLFAVLAFVLPVVNVALRFITTRPLIVPKVDQSATLAPAEPAPPEPARTGFVMGVVLICLIGLSAFVLWWCL
jgi:hypothetical protein